MRRNLRATEPILIFDHPGSRDAASVRLTRKIMQRHRRETGWWKMRNRFLVLPAGHRGDAECYDLDLDDWGLVVGQTVSS